MSSEPSPGAASASPEAHHARASPSKKNPPPTSGHGGRGGQQFSPPPPGGSAHAGGGDDASQGSKRKRVSLACNACRLRKSKCDGVRPKCSMCRDLDFDCVYQQSASSANTIVGKDYIGRLETRLLAVEQLLAAQAQNTLQHRNSEPVEGPGDVEMTHGRDIEEIPGRQAKRLRTISPNGVAASGETFVNLKSGGLEDDSVTPDTVLDGMGALNLGDEEDYGYFGPSSNIAFIGHVTRALATSGTAAFTKDLRQPDPAQDNSSRQMSPRPPSSAPGGEFEVRPGSVNLYVLPAENRVRHFVSLYFQNTNILFPYLHQPTFMEVYEQALAEGFTKVRRTWLALLNLVMAMGSRSSTEQDVTTEEKYKTAEEFYQRGYGLCNGHLLRLASLDSVICLLLMSHYLQSTRKPVQCWTTHGLAIRVAIQMGLHSSQALQRFPPLERELRKRAWYGCVLLDRTLCMTFGRPSALSSYADKLDLPLDVEDDALKNTMMTPTLSSVPANACTPASFFIHSVKLYTLLGMIIDTLYGGNVGGSDPSGPTFTDVARVAEIEERLSAWRQALPSALQMVTASDIPEDGGPPSQFWRQSIILSLRYYNTRALLHRQFVVKGLSEIWGAGPSTNKFEGDFFWNFGLASIQVCCDSAIETVEIVHKVKHRSDLLGFWWFTLYYTFNASLVLVSKVLIVSQVRQLQVRRERVQGGFGSEPGRLLRHLEMAMETMEVLATGNRIANRCRLFLKNLMRYVAPLATASPRLYQPRLHQPSGALPTPQTSTTATPYPASSGFPPNPSDMPPQQPQYDEKGQSPFRANIGEFMLESDFSYLHSMLPPFVGGDIAGIEAGMAGAGMQGQGGYGDVSGAYALGFGA